MADTVVNQVPVFAIKMMTNSEKEIRYYFDRESYLLIQKEEYITNKFSAEPVLSKSESVLVIRYDEYRTVENYLIPFVVESEFPIGWIVRKEFKFVEVNPKGVNREIFKMPVIKIAKQSAIEIEIPNK